ncbi:unnamed protein product, partial [Rotaria magnacalcarata]
LKDTRATSLFFQTIIVDPTRDLLLYKRCVSNSVRAYTMIGAWLFGRFCDDLPLWYPVDIFTIYFFIWQFMFITAKWEFQQYPIFSMTLYRGWLCLLMASDAFIIHDVLFSYLPSPFSFIFFWLLSVKDIFICLHPKGYLYTSRTYEKSSSNDQLELPNDDPSVSVQIYDTWNPENNELDEKGYSLSLGLGDFLIFNLMLLSVLPHLSSITIKMFIAIGHIVAVQIGQEATYRLGRLCDQSAQPAVPLPVIIVTLYTILLKAFINY